MLVLETQSRGKKQIDSASLPAYIGETTTSPTVISKMTSADKGTATLGSSWDGSALDIFAAVDEKEPLLRRSAAMANEESLTRMSCPPSVRFRLIGSTIRDAYAPQVSTLSRNPREMASTIGSPLRNTPYIGKMVVI